MGMLHLTAGIAGIIVLCMNARQLGIIYPKLVFIVTRYNISVVIMCIYSATVFHCGPIAGT